MIRRPPRSTQGVSSAASDVYKRQASFAIPVLSAAVFAYFVLRNQPEAFKLAALTFTAGLLTVAAIEDMVSEAHESGDDTHISPLAFIGGFVLFVLVSAGLEGVVSQS